jgi:hypothetical protein
MIGTDDSSRFYNEPAPRSQELIYATKTQKHEFSQKEQIYPDNFSVI